MMRRIIGLAIVALVTACGDSSGPATPVPGALAVRYTTPITNDRSLLVEISGPAAATNARSTDASTLVFSRAAGTTTRIAVIGTLTTNTQVVRFDVPDVNQVNKYSARITEVGTEANTLRIDLKGISVKVEKAP